MHAQNYTELWAEVQQAFNSDLPKTALDHLKTIRQKALEEDCSPQLLRALCTEYTLAHEISPDSDAVMVRHIEEALAAETRPVERALWENVLGQITRSRTHLMASVSNPELLAATKATDYVPAFVVGKDSRWFNDDLLSVLSMTIIETPSFGYGMRYGVFETSDLLTNGDRRDVFLQMRRIYEAQHNAEALLMVDYFGYTRELYTEGLDDGILISRIREVLPAMKAQGKDNAARVLAAWVESKEAPDVSLNWCTPCGAFAPDTPASAVLASRNVGKVELRLYRINGFRNTDLADDKYDEAARDRLLKSRKAVLAATYSKALQHVPAHETFNDTLDITLPSAGIYIAQLVIDGKARSTQWLSLSRVAPLIFSATSASGTKKRLTLVDVVTGQPFTSGVSAKIAANGRFADRNAWRTLTPSADGTFELPTDNNRYWTLAVGAGDDHYCATEDLYGYGPNGLYYGENHQMYAHTYTDRAIYRPGQKVMANTLVYSREGDEYKALEGWKGKLVLQDTDRKDIAELDVVTDALGQCSSEFVLPDPAIPGSYALVLRGQSLRRTQYITVEEYKRPTFRIKLDAPDSKTAVGKEHWEVGDTITLEGRVETYSGVGIPDAKVCRTTERSTFYWARGDEDGHTAVEDTLMTDAQGRFRVAIPLTAEGHYATHLEATASNGETASANHSIYVGKPVVRNRHEEEEIREWFTVVYNNRTRSEAKVHINLSEKVEGGRPICLFVDVVSTKDGILSSRRMEVSDSLDLDLVWRAEYGDAATLYISYVRDGDCFSESAKVIKPKPDKRLEVEWSTFRNLLQPGEQETWTLSVRRPDGSPADAAVMARLYDASLDAFAHEPWTFFLDFPRTSPLSGAQFSPTHNFGIFYTAPWPTVGDFLLTTWEPTMFDYFGVMQGLKGMADGAAVHRSKRLYAAAAPMQALGMNAKEVAAPAPSVSMDMAVETEEADAAPAEMQDVPVRENFNETAFFLPALRTDAEGKVTIAFTLPESLTEWNFTALAHDAAMNYGILNDTVVARKMLMAEIAAPRFLRQGDTTEIPVTVRNLTDETQMADVVFIVTDAATDRVLKTVRRSVTLAATNTPDATTTLTFPLEATTDVKVRVVAKAAAYSDGEERLIPVLSARELVEVSIPFSLTEPGDAVINLSSLNLARLMKQDAKCRPTISVEYCANPLWSVIRVVPALLDGEAFSATDWATRLYAIEVADFLARGLKSTEASALVDSLLAVRDIPALRYGALHHLRDFQQADGGFSWMRGFQSSPWITTDVAILLARQQVLTASTTASSILASATRYLDKEAARIVADMKRIEKEQHKAGHKDYRAAVSETALRYLYVRLLQDLKPTDDVEYLLERAALENKSLTMYGKAAVAQILQHSHPAEADRALQSLVEHTVATPEMGRYFDTDRALGGWASYKIPTQTMAIEALENTLQPENAISSQGTLASEMRLWLLQSKRTQKWESSRASADATYALLHGKTDAHATPTLFQTLHPEDHSVRTLSDAEAARAVKTASYTVSKTTDGLSWGAVRAAYTLPVEQVEASSAGFTLTRRWEVLSDGKWTPITAKTSITIGAHVRQIITLRAERDYDFVQVEASRAACMEPLHPLSGTDWLGGTFCYRMVRDNRNDYYFEHLAKGTHTFVEELIIDRAGNFATGTAHVRSTFAPEFSAYAPSTRVFATSE